MSTNPIQVAAWNPAWPGLFEREAALVKGALGSTCVAIHHIGSTAVRGLAAKPVIDMLPVVRSVLAVDDQVVIKRMQELQYEALGEFGILFRRYFRKVGFHVHVFEEGSCEISRHLGFRDHMRRNAEDRAAYGALKADLARRFSHSPYDYCSGKEAFIASIDLRVGCRGLRLVKALTDREWEAVRRLRPRKKSAIPCGDTHHHIVLILGVDIVGYAHIELVDEGKALLHAFVFGEQYADPSLQEAFYARIEEWLRTKQVAWIFGRQGAFGSRSTRLGLVGQGGKSLKKESQGS